MSDDEPLTSADLFSIKGNPWITEKERAKDYIIEDDENAEIDRFTRATFRKKSFKREKIKVVSKDATASSRSQDYVNYVNFMRNLKRRK